MTNTKAIIAIMAIIMALITPSFSSSDNQLAWLSTSSTSCKGSVGECMLLGDEYGEDMEFDDEVTRRMLATRRYISYGALKRNSVPCSRRGASYYNCRRGGQANPYSRGCSAITRCRR